MKSNQLTVPVTGSRKRVQISNPFTWLNLAKVYSFLSFGAIKCNESEAKLCTLLLVILYVFLLLGGSYDLALIQEGGIR